MTLLQIVQNTLSAMEADNVNDISSSTESSAIARIAEEVYFELMAQGDWPFLQTVSKLTSISDSDYPNCLEIPSNIKSIKRVWYNNTELKYKTVEDFIEYTNQRDISSENIVEINTIDSGIVTHIDTSKHPTYFTLLNDKYVITDSYYSVEDTTLVGSKSMISVTVIPTWTESNTFTPDMPDHMFPTYLAMVKRAAFLYLRREQSIKDERAALAGLGRLYVDPSRLFMNKPSINYGRKR